MSMHRLLVDIKRLDESSPSLPKEALHHLKVLRIEDGEEVELFDGKGGYRVYEWRTGALVARDPSRMMMPAPKPLTLFACVTKGSRWDWTIEKATELGVTRIVPVISARTIVRLRKEERAMKRERWLRIAEDAARQSDAKWVPEILEALDFDDALPLVEKSQCFIGALTTPPSPLLRDAFANRDGREVAVFIGPEGDFSPEELSALMRIATPVSFGPTILRAETAAIFAVSTISHFLL